MVSSKKSPFHVALIEASVRHKEESRKEFQNVLDTYLELTYFEKRQSFCDGFRIGAGVMCEIFHDRSVRSNL